MAKLRACWRVLVGLRGPGDGNFRWADAAYDEWLIWFLEGVDLTNSIALICGVARHTSSH